MLPKLKRLTAKDFIGLKTRIVYRGAFFDIAISPAQTTKYTCVIAKKRIKKAVDRNKVKRKITTLLSNYNPIKPLFIIVYPTKTTLSASFQTLKEELDKAFGTLVNN